MKTFRFIGFTLFAILLCLSACSSGGDDLEPEPEIQIPAITDWYAGDINELTTETHERTFSFTANFEWFINVTYSNGKENWCTILYNS